MIYFDGFGLSVEGGKPTKEVLAATKHLIYQVRSEAEARGLHAFKKYAYLPNGGYIYALKHGGLGRAHIVLPESGTTDTPEYVRFGAPDFASGILLDGIIRNKPTPDGGTQNVVENFYPTGGTRNRLNIGAGPIDTPRFALEPDALRDDLRNPSLSSGAVTWAQHMALKPTMFSGRMVRLAQALMGFGKPGVPGAFASMFKALHEEDGGTGLPQWTPYQQRVLANGFQVLYDNRFYRTHGLATGAGDKRWLVQVSPSGVYAMPLPLWPKTDTAKFRTKLEELGDDEALTLLDEFGGFPTGESFPAIAGGYFEASVRAGVVVRMLPGGQMAAGPYSQQPFSTGMGWAFNMKGTEAHNVMYEYGADDFMYTEHWHLQFSIGSEVPPQTNTAAQQASLRSLLSVLSGPQDYIDIVLGKLPWVESSALSSFISTAVSDPVGAFNALDQHQVTRFSASCGMGRSGRNVVWWPGVPTKAPAPMKFYEPLLPGLMNVNFNKLGFQSDGRPPAVQNSIVHVYFIGDQLNYVRWYWDRTGKTYTDIDDDYEDCMYAGSWTRVARSGTTTYPPMFFHTQIDPRDVPAPSETTTKIRSVYMLVSPPIVGDDPTLPSRGWATRTHYFKRDTNTVSVSGRGRRSAVIVPAFTREGVLFGWAEEQGTTYTTDTRDYPGLTDPWWYELTRMFGIIRPGPSFGGGWVPTSDKCGWFHADRRVVVEFYSPYECSDLVDSGPWLSECQTVNNTNWTFPLGSSSIVTTSNKQVFRVLADYPPLGGMVQVHLHEFAPTAQNPYLPWDSNWFYPSPDEYGNIQHAWAFWNGLGDADLVVGSTGPSGYGPGIFRGTPDREVFRAGPTFVGVVDGSV